jgi:hypothetical protein
MKDDARQTGRKAWGVKSLIFLCALGPLLASGCMSARVTTNLKPEANPDLKSPAGRFYVAGLKYKYADANPRIPIDQKTMDDAERRLLPLVNKECASRYPALFVDGASSGSIPLGVEVNCTTTQHTGKSVAWMLCTLDICGLILPCPGGVDEDFDVKAGVSNGRGGVGGAPLQKSFRREDHFWVSVMTPSALIHMPGESDFPKFSGTVFNIQEQMETSYQQTAQQVATALAQLVATKEPEFWVVPVGSESSPATLSSTPTTTLPPPAEPATPF